MSDATQTAAPAGSTLLGGDTPAAPAPAPAPAASPAPTPTAAPVADPAKPAPDTPADPNAEAPKPELKDGEKKEGDDKAAGAPEKYEFKTPEGVQLDDALVGEFSQIAKELNLPQEAAQKLVDLSARMQQGNVVQLQAAIEAQGETWANDARVDKEYGGDQFDQNLAVARKALDEFGTPEFKTLLTQSKMGNHPEVLRFFYRAGKALSEDGFVPGRAPVGQKSDAEVFYGQTK